ncbi:MAG: transcriptional repressor LexA [Gammaproteobacteria bacterium]|nr:transcriptional repressor LexA [Gammaproteobacteria bacterium]
MLTQSQQKTLNFIRGYMDDHGLAPTLVEIGKGVGIQSKGVVHRHVQALKDKGYLERGNGWRAMRLTDDDPSKDALPLLGRIAAGRPIEAIPDKNKITFDELFRGTGRYVLQIRGDSMIDAGILDRDFVIIQHADSASDNDIVVALIDEEEATLKRLKMTSDGQVMLIPENSAMKPMLFEANRVRIQGKVIGQVRTYF